MQERRRAAVERRRGRRAPFVAAVRHKVGAEVQLALAQNLGPTGIELKRPAGRAYLPRTPVSLSFALPDGGDLVRVQGAIVFERAANGYHTTGVRFLAMSPLDHARIVRALRYL
jgi:PilZ domain